MTMEPEFPKKEDKEEPKLSSEKLASLEDLFYLGYTKSDKRVLYDDPDKNVSLTVVFRTLTPTEIRDIFEKMNVFSSFAAQAVTEKIETLARCIFTLNDMPLVLPPDEKEKFNKVHGRDPSPLEQARIIMIEKVATLHVIDLIYEAYQEFLEEIQEHFTDIKKKLKNQTSSESISP